MVEVWNEGPYPFIRLSDGRVYQASTCRDGLDYHLGNDIRFIALRPGLASVREHTTVPVIVYCTFPGFWVDNVQLPQ